jgi:hypothetical protein
MRGNNYLRSELHVKSGFVQLRLARLSKWVEVAQNPVFMPRGIRDVRS